MGYLEGNENSYVFKKAGVSGPGFTSRNAANFIDLRNTMLQRAREYASISNTDLIKDGWVFHDFNAKGTKDSPRYELVFVNNGERQVIPVNGSAFFACNVSKHYKDEITLKRRIEKQIERENQLQEEQRLAEAKKLNRIEELERMQIEIQSELLSLKGK